MIQVIQPGMLTTVQDRGRYRYQRIGMPVAGAMDRYSLSLGNILVGNHQNAAALECTILGPALRFETDEIFALTGADFGATLDGAPVRRGCALLARAGQTLRLPAARSGARGYIAFAGGLDLPEVMGSRSTYLKGRIGGLEGRALKAGDTLGLVAPQTDLPNLHARFVSDHVLWPYSDHHILRVVPGTQYERFSQEGVHALLTGEYTVTPENDRMGYRLNGPAISFAPGYGGNIISDGIYFGAIQVPKDQPIIMMADRQTTGGYAKIAGVISVDLPYMAQRKTGDTVRFEMVTVDEAQSLLLRQDAELTALRNHLDNDVILEKKYYSVSVDGRKSGFVLERVE